MSIRSSGGTALKELTVSPGSTTTLTAAAVYSHLPLKADQAVFTWTVDGDIGDISVGDTGGILYAEKPGAGTITVSAGGQSASIKVTVSKVAYSTAEDFETAFSAPVSYTHLTLPTMRTV